MENNLIEFKNCLKWQMENHASIEPRDLVKLCYQAAFGAEHLLKDRAGALKYFESEYAKTPATTELLAENISQKVCRVNLGAWKSTKMPEKWLFEMFCASSSVEKCGKDMLEKYFAATLDLLKSGNYSVKDKDFEEFLIDYRKNGMGAVHHSDGYRDCEKPAYRIVDRDLLEILPVLELVSEKEKREGRPFVIAIDGRAASGKTTLAKKLEQIMGAAVVHMDDFFLPPSLRTPERLASAGGNVHYERFKEEVLPNLCQIADFEYRAFDCSVMDMGANVEVKASDFVIVEGSYSAHPNFGEYYDVLVFASVDEKEQKRRILSRNGEKLLEMFTSRWIPMEEKYFKEFLVEKKAHVHFSV